MRVLHASFWNAAGTPAEHAYFESRYGLLSEAVCQEPDYQKRPIDYQGPHWHAFVDRADIVVVYDHLDILSFVANSGKPYVFRACGTSLVEKWNEIEHILGQKIRRQTDSFEFLVDGYKYFPRPVEIDRYERYADREGGYVVCHAPTHPQFKGTEHIMPVVEEFDHDLILYSTHEECLIRKGKCDVYIDQIAIPGTVNEYRSVGIGYNGIECMCMKIPVIGHAVPEFTAAIERTIGGHLPFIDTPIDKLRDTLLRLRDDPDYYDYWAEYGYSFVQTFMDPKERVQSSRKLYEEVIERW